MQTAIPKCWTTWLIVAVVLASSLFLALGAKEGRKTIEAEEIALRDKTGRVRASIHLGERGAPEFTMFDDGGNSVLQFTSDPAGIVLSNNATDQHIRIGLSKDQRAQIELARGEKQEGIAIGVTSRGGLHLTFKDKNGIPRLAMGLAENTDIPILTFSDASKNEAISLGTMKDGSNGLKISDATGAKRLEIGTPADGASSIYLYDRNGHRVIDFAVNLTGKAGLRIFDKSQHCRIGMQLLQDGSVALGAFGANGKLRLSLGVGSDDAAELTVLEPNEQVRANLRVDKRGDPSFELFDKEGRGKKSTPN